MKNQCKSIFSTCHWQFLVFVLSVTLTLGIDPKDEFNYKIGSGKDPSRWGDLKPDWKECKTGHMQSPVDITVPCTANVASIGQLSRHYKPAVANLTKIHDVEVKWLMGEAGYIVLDGTKNFTLKNAHWHEPSEHDINGRRYDLELHMVHVNVDQTAVNKITVIAHLYEFGDPDPFLTKLTKCLVEKEDEPSFTVNVNPKEIKKDFSLYYKYMGSLTTPPCFENVTWIIDQTISTVSKEQVQVLKDAIGDKGEGCARPVQSLNKRIILGGTLIQS